MTKLPSSQLTKTRDKELKNFSSRLNIINKKIGKLTTPTDYALAKNKKLPYMVCLFFCLGLNSTQRQMTREQEGREVGWNRGGVEQRWKMGVT